jgi:glyoxylase-like metal-dependent hydrolase (beta-lactamase superfamily II)
MRPIDTLHLGQARAICCWQYGEVLIDPGPTCSLQNVLDALEGWVPTAVLLTHIHFDHAASAGTLARMYPDLKVYVHERGYPHMLDPSRLWASASRLYGEDNMELLWGRFEPVPEQRLISLSGSETLEIGNDSYAVAYTPGHAQHHVSFLTQDGTAFVGDVGGCRIEPGAPVLPPTPPPDINPVLWHESIDTIRSWKPERMGITHFGLVEDPDAVLTECGERLDVWSNAARSESKEQWIAAVEDDLRAKTSPEVFETFRHAVPTEQSYAGLKRYWDKLRAA